MQYQSSWLNEIETIVLTCAHEVSQPTQVSANLVWSKIAFTDCSNRAKRRRIAEKAKTDQIASTVQLIFRQCFGPSKY